MTSPRPQVSNATAHRLFQLVEPIAVVTYLTPEPTEAVMALGAGAMWGAYFAPGPRAGLALYAAVRTLPVPTEALARLWHANLLREHRGDGQVAAVLSAAIGGTEAHVLHARAKSMPAEQFGRDGWNAIRLIGDDD